MKNDKATSQGFTLVVRQCLCGCGCRFKTIPDSPSYFASVFHDARYRREFDSGRMFYLQGTKPRGRPKRQVAPAQDQPLPDEVPLPEGRRYPTDWDLEAVSLEEAGVCTTQRDVL